MVPRRRGRDRLLHLVNMGLATTEKNFTVSLSKEFAGPIKGATLHAPDHPPLELATRSAGRFTEIRVPVLEEWGVVTLR